MKKFIFGVAFLVVMLFSACSQSVKVELKDWVIGNYYANAETPENPQKGDFAFGVSKEGVIIPSGYGELQLFKWGQIYHIDGNYSSTIVIESCSNDMFVMNVKEGSVVISWYIALRDGKYYSNGFGSTDEVEVIKE